MSEGEGKTILMYRGTTSPTFHEAIHVADRCYEKLPPIFLDITVGSAPCNHAHLFNLRVSLERRLPTARVTVHVAEAPHCLVLRNAVTERAYYVRGGTQKFTGVHLDEDPEELRGLVERILEDARQEVTLKGCVPLF